MVLGLLKEPADFIKSVTGKNIIVKEPVTLWLVVLNDKQRAISKREYTFEKGTKFFIDEKNKNGGFVSTSYLYDMIMILKGSPKGVKKEEEIQFLRHRTVLQQDFKKHFAVS